MEKKSSNDGNTFVEQELDLSSQLPHNDSVTNDATTCMVASYQMLNTYITHKALFHIFLFLCQYLIPVFKVMPSLQVLKLVCILLSVILLNNLHTLQSFKNHPLFHKI